MHGVLARFSLDQIGSIDTVTAKQCARLETKGWQLQEYGRPNILATIGAADHLVLDGVFFAGLTWVNNRSELRQKLNVNFDEAVTDLALLARLWLDKGGKFPKDVSGAFSFIVFDPRHNEVAIYRDHFGIVPLYYCQQPGQLTCGTDLRAVLHLSGLPVKANTKRLADFIVGEEIDREQTAFAELKRLPGAHRLSFDVQAPEEVCVPQRYWALPLPAEIPLKDAPNALRTHLENACLACIDPPGRLGTMLSGGLDSSSLTALVAHALSDQGRPALPALSFGYPGRPYDESAYFNELNSHSHTHPELISVSHPPDLAELPSIVDEQMDVFLAYGLQKSRAIYHAGHDCGLTYLVDGHGGDEVISHGYGHLIELATTRRWYALISAARGAASVHGASFGGLYLLLIGRYGGLSKRNLVRRMILRVAHILQRDQKKTSGIFDASVLLASTVTSTNALDEETRCDSERANNTDASDPKNREKTEHRKVLQAPLMEHAFEVLHRAACAADILPVYPFYDRQFVEFCLSLPSEAKLRNGTTRWVLREGLKDILPEKIRTRKTKADFNAEFEASVRNHVSSNDAPFYSGTEAFVDIDVARRLEQSIRDTPQSDVAELRAYWRVLVLREWLTALNQWRKLQESGELI